jgi:hypothetical protein
MRFFPDHSRRTADTTCSVPERRFSSAIQRYSSGETSARLTRGLILNRCLEEIGLGGIGDIQTFLVNRFSGLKSKILRANHLVRIVR